MATAVVVPRGADTGDEVAALVFELRGLCPEGRAPDEPGPGLRGRGFNVLVVAVGRLPEAAEGGLELLFERG